jgi:putative ABC transport system substrate-binding protein
MNGQTREAVGVSLSRCCDPLSDFEQVATSGLVDPLLATLDELATFQVEHFGFAGAVARTRSRTRPPAHRRRRFLLTSLAGALAASVGGVAQGAQRVSRVGILWGIRPGPDWTAGGPFFGPMRELGWVEGQNIVFEHRHANEQPELLPILARELIASKVDVIVTAPSSALRAAKEATVTIPIVFAEVSKPVRRGFVASLSRPGGNITSLADVSLELIPKRLELLKELMSGATRVALLVDPDFYPLDVTQEVLEDSKRASRALGLRLETFEVRTLED